MGSKNEEASDEGPHYSPPSSSSSSPSSHAWKTRIVIPTLLAGLSFSLFYSVASFPQNFSWDHLAHDEH